MQPAVPRGGRRSVRTAAVRGAMQQLLLHLSLLCTPLARIMSASAGAAGINSIFVSPDGSDGNDGSKSAPFLTMYRAQQAARATKQRLGHIPPVVLEQGTHRASAQPALVFTEDDSGTPQSEALWLSAPTNVSNQNARAARVSGGIRLVNWEQAPGHDGVWRANASGLGNSTSWSFRTLRIGDSMWPSARWPLASAPHPWLFLANWSCDPQFHPCTSVRNDEEGRLHTGRVESSIPATLGIDPRDSLALRDCASADLNLFGGFERDVFSQVLPLHQSSWNFSNPSRPTLEVECYGYKDSQRYFVSNVKRGLVPGTWWLDRQEELLYVYPDKLHAPTADEWLRISDVSAPHSNTLITIHGTQCLQLSRLAFVDTTTQWQGYMGSRDQVTAMSSTERSYDVAAAGWPDCAVHIDDGSAQITISNSSFKQLGGCGVAIRGDVERVHVDRCLFTEIAAHAIMVHGFEGASRVFESACQPSMFFGFELMQKRVR